MAELFFSSYIQVKLAAAADQWRGEMPKNNKNETEFPVVARTGGVHANVRESSRELDFDFSIYFLSLMTPLHDFVLSVSYLLLVFEASSAVS